MTTGERVQELMDAHNFSCQQLATATGMPYHTIYRLLNGKHKDLKLIEARRLARALGQSLDDFAEPITEAR